MKSLKWYINKYLHGLDEQHLYEMATIDKDVILDRMHRSVQIHGTNSGDRENPHIHIYNAGDKIGFNFEISLVDLICYDEINLISMIDKKKGISIRNRNKCSWNGYHKTLNDFEDWLFSDKRSLRGEFIDNLDALVYSYNNESYQLGVENPLLKYLSDRALKVHEKYRYLFDEEELKTYNMI